LKQLERAFAAVVANVPMPWLAPLGTIIPSWLMAGIVLDASGLFFHCWLHVICVEQVGRRAWQAFCMNAGSCF
jgi:hypothetical protein